jgi:hypothetical protein
MSIRKAAMTLFRNNTDAYIDKMEEDLEDLLIKTKREFAKFGMELDTENSFFNWDYADEAVRGILFVQDTQYPPRGRKELAPHLAKLGIDANVNWSMKPAGDHMDDGWKISV